MDKAAVYQPGVCNIGPAKIRRRRMSGYVGLAVAGAFFGIPALFALVAYFVPIGLPR